MRNLLFATIIFLMVGGKIANAQGIGNTFPTAQPAIGISSNAPQTNDAHTLLGKYITNSRNSGLEGRNVLESVHARGLAKTPENVKSIRSLLSSTVTSDEKVVLARILGSLYTYDDKTGMNNGITQDLKGAIYSGQKDVARAGVLAYSRLGYFQDSNEVLLHAKNNSLINTDEYYGELAHIVAYAPANDQVNIISKIKDGNNQYAMEILAFITQDADALKKVYPETQKVILASLEKNEPGFGMAIGEFGFVEAVRYATWLQSVAVLSSATKNIKYENVVFAHLNDDTTDPRKIMAFLMSSDGKRLIKNIGQNDLFQSALNRIALYSKQLPQNVIMKDIVQDITTTVNSVKR